MSGSHLNLEIFKSLPVRIQTNSVKERTFLFNSLKKTLIDNNLLNRSTEGNLLILILSLMSFIIP